MIKTHVTDFVFNEINKYANENTCLGIRCGLAPELLSHRQDNNQTPNQHIFLSVSLQPHDNDDYRS